MLESIITLLIYVAIFALVLYVVLWVLAVIGISLPPKVVQIIWVIFALIVLLWLVRAVIGAGGIALPVISPAWSQPAPGHTGPQHWYATDCCSGRDCAPLPALAVLPTQEGWQLQTGNVVPYGSSKERDSKDGRFHLCSTPAGELRCLYVPGMGM